MAYLHGEIKTKNLEFCLAKVDPHTLQYDNAVYVIKDDLKICTRARFNSYDLTLDVVVGSAVHGRWFKKAGEIVLNYYLTPPLVSDEKYFAYAMIDNTQRGTDWNEELVNVCSVKSSPEIIMILSNVRVTELQVCDMIAIGVSFYSIEKIIIDDVIRIWMQDIPSPLLYNLNHNVECMKLKLLGG